MSKYINQELPFFDNNDGSVVALGTIYFGDPDTDPTDQVSNAKTPYTDRALTTAADSEQTLTAAGKLSARLYLNGAYSITVKDSLGNQVFADPHYVGESTDGITDESDYSGASLTATLNTIKSELDPVKTLSLTAIYGAIWPIGAIYITTVNENPQSRLSFGTWTAYSPGRAIAGVGTSTVDGNGDTISYTGGEEKGAVNHTLTEAEMPAHTHAMFTDSIQSAGNNIITASTDNCAKEYDNTGNNDQYQILKATNPPTVGGTSSKGSSTAHNNVGPTKGTYMWVRTA